MAGVVPSLSGQRILMSGCMTARRCAKVLAGGFQAIPGRHVVRGGQALQMTMLLIPFLSGGVPSYIVNYGSCGLLLAVVCPCHVSDYRSQQNDSHNVTMFFEGCGFRRCSIMMHHAHLCYVC